jgi:protein gp37
MFREYPRLRRLGLLTYQWRPDEVHVHPEMLEKPLHWKKPKMIFTNSMSDFFHEKIPFDFLDRVLEVIKKTPQHTYQILTKRSWRMMRYSERIGRFPANVWCGVSVESDAYKFRIDHLRKVQANVRFLSLEPLIGPINKLDLAGVQWVIVGGESGPFHRPINLEWVRTIRDQCLSETVSFFFKQVGGPKPKSGGRLLDGIEWNEYPKRLSSLPVVQAKNVRGDRTCEQVALTRSM